MKKILFFLPACLISYLLHAQQTKTQSPNPPTKTIRDTFAFNILSTIDKVLRIAEDPSKPASLLAEEQIETNDNGVGVFQSAIELPGSVRTNFNLYNTKRNEGYATWEWQAVLFDTEKGKSPDAIQAIKKKVDTLLTAFSNRKRPAAPDGNYEINVLQYVNINGKKTDQLILRVLLSKKLVSTEQSALDSLLRLYKPLLSNRSTVQQVTTKFEKALNAEDISREKCKAVYATLIKEIIDKDFEAGYQILVSAPYYIDVKSIIEGFTSSQRDAITTLGQKAVDDYYAKNKPKGSTDVVTEKKKEIEKAQPPSDPCEREVWELLIKPGAFVENNIRVAYVVSYSCNANLYTIAWLEEKRLKYDKNISPQAINAYTVSRQHPFSLCRHCKGQGYVMEYEWYYLNSYSGHYARSNKQVRVGCGECKGTGYFLIR
jgi:hypothetical protein